MKPFAEIIKELNDNLATYQQLLEAVETEGRNLRSDNGTDHQLTGTETRKTLLPKLNDSLDKLRRHRVAWQQA